MSLLTEYVFFVVVTGYKIVFPKQRITELNVQNPPSTLVADIKSKDAQILQLTGGKGNSLALLASLASEEVYSYFFNSYFTIFDSETFIVYSS